MKLSRKIKWLYLYICFFIQKHWMCDYTKYGVRYIKSYKNGWQHIVINKRVVLYRNRFLIKRIENQHKRTKQPW